MKNGTFDIRMDGFNSEHFGMKMGNVSIKRLNRLDKETAEELVQSILKGATENNYSHLTCKLDTNYIEIAQIMEKTGFFLADTSITYRFDFSKNELTHINHKCSIDDCNESDLKEIKSIAKGSFFLDRFHNDDSLSTELCDSYYEKWIENSYNGYADKVIVARYDNNVCGFTTGKLRANEDDAELVLSAVSNTYRGLGVYTSMIYEGVKWIQDQHRQDYRGLTVNTQINNIAVQKAWIRLGLVVFSSDYIFHKVL